MPLLAETVDRIVEVLEREFIDPIIKLLIGLAALIFIWGVIQFVINTDDPKGREQGKQHIIWGIIGLFIMVSAIGIVNLIIATWRAIP